MPGPGQYSPARADGVTRPLSRSTSLHARQQGWSYIPASQAPAPTSYTPREPAPPSSLQRGASFSKVPGHRGTAPSSHATGAATDGSDAAHPTIPGSGRYEPGSEVGKLRAVSYTFGVRP